MPTPLLALLTSAPALLRTGRAIYAAVSGHGAPEHPEDLARAVEALPPEQRERWLTETLAARVRHDELATQRFEAMTEGDAEKIRATARPRIALQAMAMVALWSKLFAGVVIIGGLDWLARIWVGEGATWGSPFALIAEIEPIWELWATLIVGSFWTAAAVVRSYMGARERDKAQEYEIQAGRPLDAASATIEAAGGSLAKLIRAWKRQ